MMVEERNCRYCDNYDEEIEECTVDKTRTIDFDGNTLIWEKSPYHSEEQLVECPDWAEGEDVTQRLGKDRVYYKPWSR